MCVLQVGCNPLTDQDEVYLNTLEKHVSYCVSFSLSCGQKLTPKILAESCKGQQLSQNQLEKSCKPGGEGRETHAARHQELQVVERSKDT